MKINLFTKIIFLSCFLSSNSALAWSGYDYDQKTQIDIGPGNLVREGLVIQFYDTKDDSIHDAKVINLQEGGGGADLTVEDLETGEERTFVME